MHAICETHAFRRAAARAGMSEDEVASLITYLAINPTAGDEMVGTGGCRKVRLAGRSKGKSGGYRTITFFTGAELPVFLLTVFSKGERSDLTQTEKQALRDITQDIVRTYRTKATSR